MNGENLIIPEIPEPQDDIEQQKPTRDVPTGKGRSLNEGLIKSVNSPADVQQALDNLTEKGEVADEKK